MTTTDSAPPENARPQGGRPSDARPAGARPTLRERAGAMSDRFSSGPWWLLPLLMIVLGVALGVADVAAPEVSGVLRIPALIAAFLLVGHGTIALDAGRQPRPEPAAETPDDGAAGEGGGSTGVIAVLVLSVWLGLATLAYPQTPKLLLTLSLLAAFLLFTHALKESQGGPSAG